MKKIHLLLLCLLCAVSIRLGAQTMRARLDSLFTAPGNFEKLNGAVLIAENGRIMYQRGFGFADLKQNRPNTTVSSFNIGSVTKTFTSTAVLQLLEKGKLNLDDFYQKYFPSFPYPNITIRHLLTHTSGLTDLETYFRVLDSLPDKMFTDADIIPSIIRLHRPLKFLPGNNFEYCNINFELLALLVEGLSGIPYHEYIQRNIFRPTGMIHSYLKAFPPVSADPNRVNNYMLAKFYSSAYIPSDSMSSPRLKQLMYNFNGLMGDGNIISTEEDLLLFDEALYNGKLLHAQTLADAFSPSHLAGNKDYNMFSDMKLGKIQYGLGWEVYIDSSMGKIVSHGGHYPGIWTSFVRNISKHQTIIIFDNNDWSGADLLSTMALDIINDKPVANLLSKRSLARVYGQMLVDSNAEASFSKLVEIKDDTIHYVLREREMNTLGYQLLEDGYLPQALETFGINILLFPKSANAYDSYGDALAKAGHRDEAVRMYGKSLSLAPDNRETKDKIRVLQK
jgi:CubicO group peptidase (beta-lactamase class C family)